MGGAPHRAAQGTTGGHELAHRQREKERAAAQSAEDARVEAQQTAQIEAKIAAYKAQVRGAWVGDQASFDAAWPAILQQCKLTRPVWRSTGTGHASWGSMGFSALAGTARSVAARLDVPICRCGFV
jgi:hypothetical protein